MLHLGFPQWRLTWMGVGAPLAFSLIVVRACLSPRKRLSSPHAWAFLSVCGLNVLMYRLIIAVLAVTNIFHSAQL